MQSFTDDNDPSECRGVHRGDHPALPRHHQPLHRDPQDPRESQQKVIPPSQAFIWERLQCDNTDNRVAHYLYLSKTINLLRRILINV